MIDKLSIDVIVCTYNNCHGLDETLRALHAQVCVANLTWSILVVDNNCSDNTDEVLKSWEHSGRVTVLYESIPGLNYARKKGVRSSGSDWVVFIDDDNIVAKDYLHNAVFYINKHKDMAGFNGRNECVFSGNPLPYVRELECFANTNPGDASVQRDWLHGAGLFLRRDLILKSGWLDHSVLDDRSAGGLQSGGDNELSIRVGVFGDGLWYHPRCHLEHHIDKKRTKIVYLAKLNFAIAKSRPLLSTLNFEGDYSSWRKIWDGKVPWYRDQFRRNLKKALLLRRSPFFAVISLSDYLGIISGLRKLHAIRDYAVDNIFGISCKVKK